eukprot:scaffold332_cov117-Cylindrotheca_fusiformis.AAC.25
MPLPGLCAACIGCGISHGWWRSGTNVTKWGTADWMDASFKAKSENQGLLNSGASFDYVLLELADRRALEEQPAPVYYKAVFRGFSVWNLASPDTEPVSADVVELMQRATLLEKNSLKEQIRQNEDADYDLVDIKVSENDSDGTGDGDDSTDKTLQIIIMIAIVVACLAFCLLMFAVVWAWRTDRAKRDAYKENGNTRGNTRTFPAAETSPRKSPRPSSRPVPPARSPAHSPPPPKKSNPPEEIPSQSDYPDSVISDSGMNDSYISNDLETSYTGYSMPHQPSATTPSATFQPRELNHNDAQSVSSMDSYGYSLDGYASSLGGPSKYPGGALSMPADTSGGSLGADEESEVDLDPSVNGDSYKY